MTSPAIGDLIVPRTATVRESLVVIDRTAQGLAFVADDAGRLVGVITDGDIRRALLAGTGLEATVDRVMRPDFVALPVSAAPEEIIRALDERIRIVPLLDAAGRPVDYASVRRQHRIPVMEPSLSGNELAYVVECIRTNWVSSQGKFVQRFEEMFAERCGAGEALAVSNGTAALHLALVALGVGPGDEVIVPDLTFAASANAVIHAGATPVFADVSPGTWTLDPARAAEAVTPRTRAIMPVHLYGHPCDMDPLMALARGRGLVVVEDCAEALGSTYRGRHVGAFGDAGCFSFFGNKTITTGEGGMIVFRRAEAAARARMLRDHGMSPDKRYWHVEVGYNYRLTNLQAAVGVAQLERMDTFLERRREIAGSYVAGLEGAEGVTLPPAAPWATNVHWLYPLLIDEAVLGTSRDEVMAKLALNGIETRPLFYPLHEMPPYRALAAGRAFPVTERLSRAGFSVPSATTLSREEIGFICAAVRRITGTKKLLIELFGPGDGADADARSDARPEAASVGTRVPAALQPAKEAALLATARGLLRAVPAFGERLIREGDRLAPLVPYLKIALCERFFAAAGAPGARYAVERTRDLWWGAAPWEPLGNHLVARVLPELPPGARALDAGGAPGDRLAALAREFPRLRWERDDPEPGHPVDVAVVCARLHFESEAEVRRTLERLAPRARRLVVLEPLEGYAMDASRATAATRMLSRPALNHNYLRLLADAGFRVTAVHAHPAAVKTLPAHARMLRRAFPGARIVPGRRPDRVVVEGLVEYVVLDAGSTRAG